MDMLHLVVDCQTSHCVWHTLEQALASPSNSHIIQLHGSFQNLYQGDDSITIYLQKTKALFDELSAVHRPLSLPDFNLYVLYGFQGEFKDLMTSLFTKAEPFSYVDLHNHLLTHEFLYKSSLQSMTVVVTALLLSMPAQPPSAFVAQCQYSDSSHNKFNSHFGRGRFRGGWQNNNNNQNINNTSSGYHGFNRYNNGNWKQGNWHQGSHFNNLQVQISMLLLQLFVIILWLPKTSYLTTFLASSNSSSSRAITPHVHEPISFSDIVKYKTWHNVIKPELQALSSNDTWYLVPFHHSMNVVGSC
jgi:hypothetical protein